MKISNTLSTRRFWRAIIILEIQGAAKLTDIYKNDPNTCQDINCLQLRCSVVYKKIGGQQHKYLLKTSVSKLQIKTHRYKDNY